MPPDVVVAKRLEQCRFLVGHYTDVGATRKWVVAPVAQTYPFKEGIEVVDVMTAIQRVAEQNQRNE
jgi:hypothetical protein